MNMKSIFSLPKESIEIEYKARFTPYIGNTICGFLNTMGGKLYIGIDERGEIIEPDEDTIKRIDGLINHGISPSPSKWINICTENWLGKNIIIVSVSQPEMDEIFTFNGKSFIRVGDTNRLLSSDKSYSRDAIINNRKIESGLFVLSEYVPSNIEVRKIFEETKRRNNVHFKRLGQPSKNTSSFFKYCSLDVALSIFRKEKKAKRGQKRNPSQTMRFVEPPSWDDQYERRFYTANYKKIPRGADATPKLYATCFTPREESEPAWQIYNRGKEGLGKRCVQFRINQVALRNELIKNLKNCTIVEGVVDYKSKSFIDELHLSTTKEGNVSDLFKKYFSNFTLDNFINLLLLKRTAYEHEKEVRIFIIFDKDKMGKKSVTKETANHQDVSLDWLMMLEGIKVDSECSDIEIKLLQDEIDRLIEDCNRTKKTKKDLHRKLIVTRYNVNEDEEGNHRIGIGETYADYEKRVKVK